MAMDSSNLGDEIKTAIDALTDEQKKNRTLVFRAMAQAIVDHIKNNAEVSTTVNTTVSGTGTGGPGAHPVVGTGTQTGAPGTIT